MTSTATPERQDKSDSPKSGAAGAPAAEPVGCPKCGNLDSWGTASWCPRCGFYPRLGTCVGSPGATDTDSESHPAPTSYLEALARLPQWAYILAAGVLGIFVISLVIRILTPEDSFARSALSLAQLVIGGGTFLSMHVYVFVRTGMKSNKLGGFDVLIRPIEVWRPTFQALPKTARLIWAGMWGLTAAVCAMAVIGGIRYEALTEDWGFKERPKKNMLKQIKEQILANAKDGADNLEDAIDEFAGDDEAAKKKAADEKKKKAELEMLSNDCLVVGYNVDQQTNEINELIVASDVDGKLRFVGTVTGGIPPQVQQQLQERLLKIEQKQPFVKCPATAKWVKPVVTCRINFKTWTSDKRMDRPVFKEILADVK